MKQLLIRSIPVLFLLLIFLLIYFRLDPFFLPIRSIILPITILLVLCGLLYTLSLPKTDWSYLLTICLIGFIALLAAQEIKQQYYRHFVASLSPAEASQLGQHFIVGYRDFDQVSKLAAQGVIGGIFITRHNIAGKSKKEIWQEIYQLQKIRLSAGLSPLAISVDQEGGIVSRLSPPLDFYPPLADIAELDAYKEVTAYQYGYNQGKELAHLGVTINFSPVVDLKPSVSNNRFDFHTQIARRAIASNPTQVIRIAQAYSQGLSNAGVRPTLKHFPGLGHVQEDSHHFAAYLNRSYDELINNDWLPFIELAKNDDNMIMVSHIIVPALDSEWPASMSKILIEDTLRGRFGFKGLLVTDDMSMRSANRLGICDATVAAIDAGMDLLLISYDHDKFYEAFYCLATNAQSKQTHFALTKSAKRLERLHQPSCCCS